MTDEDALLASIRAAPDDDLPRLVYADWLDEHGGADRAEFVRVQCEKWALEVQATASPIPGPRDLTDRIAALARRERDLLLSLAESFQPAPGWCVVTPPGWPRPDWPVWAVVRRGFIEEVTCDADAWLAHADDLLRRHPVRQVRLTTWPDFADNRYRQRGIPSVVRQALDVLWPGIAFELPHPSPVLADLV